MHLLWVGGPTSRIELGSFRLLTDPMFGKGPEAFIMNGHPSTGEDNVPIARRSPLPPVEVDELDLVLASHLHSDHFDAPAVERLDKGLPVVAPTANVPQLQDWGFNEVEGMDWRQERSWHKHGERLRLLALPAHHSHDAQVSHELGVVNGYLLEHHTDADADAFRIYWTGDTVWFDELHQIAEEIPDLDLLLPHLGGVGKDGPWGLMSLDAAEAARVVRVTRPRTVIPVHHSTFSHYVEPISELAKALATSRYTGQLVILDEGQSWTSGLPAQGRRHGAAEQAVRSGQAARDDGPRPSGGGFLAWMPAAQPDQHDGHG
jgi:N-acyl-phosphatidylethanolamine-hydrolysing phospholipase D